MQCESIVRTWASQQSLADEELVLPLLTRSIPLSFSSPWPVSPSLTALPSVSGPVASPHIPDSNADGQMLSPVPRYQQQHTYRLHTFSSLSPTWRLSTVPWSRLSKVKDQGQNRVVTISIDWLSSVYCFHQHSISYLGVSFTGQKIQPTGSKY